MSTPQSDIEPMEPSEYCWPNHTAGRLLDDDGHPVPELDGTPAGGLAVVAAAMCRHGRKLTTNQWEIVARWAKHGKATHQPVSRPHGDHWRFRKLIEELKDSPDQRSLLAQTQGLLLFSKMVFAAAVVIGGTLLGLWNLTLPQWLVGWQGVVADFALLGLANHLGTKSLVAAKEQEQRYLWASIRHAETVEELNTAGLFAFLPGARWFQGCDEAAIRARMRNEAERLSDAVYRDPQGYIWTARDSF